jgi:hypothetical protein
VSAGATPGSRGRFAVLGLALFFTYAYFYQAGGWNQNSRFDLVRAIVGQGTLRIDAYQDNTGDKAVYRRHVYSDKAPGLALTAVPVVAAARPLVAAAGAPPESSRGVSALSYLATIATSGVGIAVAAACLGLAAARLFESPSAGLFVAVSFGLASPAWAYATLFMGHALAAACLGLGFCGALVLPAVGARRQTLVACAVGLAAGWAVVTDLTSAIPSALIAGFALWQVRSRAADRWRVGSGVAAGALACAAILMGYNQVAFGSALHIGYASEAGAFPELKTGFYGITSPKLDVIPALLFGQFRGLLPVAPVLALAPVGWWLWGRLGRERAALLVVVLIPLYYLWLNSSYYYWNGGWSYGPRHMTPALPFWALALAPVWAKAPRPARAGLAGLCAIGVALTLVGVSVTAQPPITYDRPMAQLWWPAFMAGDLSVGHTSFTMAGWNPELVRNHPEAHQAWNLGELAGLRGRASLLPLVGAWAIAALAIWRVRWPQSAG